MIARCKFISILLLTFLSVYTTKAQEHKDDAYWRAMALISHTVIDAGQVSGPLIVPSFGFDLEYWFNHSAGLGWHSDVEIESFQIYYAEGTSVKKNFPIVSTIDMLWKPWRDLVLMAGPGVEFEQSHNYYLVRMGLEYEISFGHHWDIAPSFFYDKRIGADFNTFSLGLGLGKRF